MSDPKRILIDPPGEAVILAARHLDATEGRVQVGSSVDAAARSAITCVLNYIATAYNAPPVADGRSTPRRPCRYCTDPLCPEDCPECGCPMHDLDAVPAWRRSGAQPEGRNPVDQQEQAAPVDWEAIARDRERELKLLGDARRYAEAEVDRLRAGEEPGWDPLTAPTPGQWIARFNRASAAERLDVAQRFIGYTATAGECFEMNHTARLDEGREALVALARVRELRDSWLLMTLEPGQVRRLLDGITRALDGTGEESPSGLAPDAEPARFVKIDGVLSEGGFDAAREALRQMDADPHGTHTGMVVHPYIERGVQKWVFRCWGTDTCDGFLSLDHTSQQWAEQAWDRHAAEEHADARAAEHNEALPWFELSTSGLLWLINRTVFHPRGLALTFHVEGDTAHGWSLVRTPGGEPWQFDEKTDADGHALAEATLAAALNPPKGR